MFVLALEITQNKTFLRLVFWTEGNEQTLSQSLTIQTPLTVGRRPEATPDTDISCGHEI